VVVVGFARNNHGDSPKIGLSAAKRGRGHKMRSRNVLDVLL